VGGSVLKARTVADRMLASSLDSYLGVWRFDFQRHIRTKRGFVKNPCCLAAGISASNARSSVASSALMSPQYSPANLRMASRSSKGKVLPAVLDSFPPLTEAQDDRGCDDDSTPKLLRPSSFPILHFPLSTTRRSRKLLPFSSNSSCAFSASASFRNTSLSRVYPDSIRL